ncbi:MAG: C25 family cysteine peptidase [bacterium]|nr:C25 family cysteine peptidase [bacterium]
MNQYIIILSLLFSVSHCLAFETVEFKDPWSKPGVNISKSGKGGLELTFSVGQYMLEDKLVDGKSAKAIKMNGSMLPIGAGYPDLPVVSNYVAVPNGAKPKVTVLSYREEIYQNMEIAPGMELPADLDKSIKPLQKRSSTYSKDEFFPGDFVITSDIQKMRGVDVLILSFAPFRYNPVTKELVVRRDMKVSVTFEGGKGEFGDDLYRHPMFERILQQNIVNYSSIQPSQYTQIHDISTAAKTSGSKEAGEFEYIIIVPDDAGFKSWAETLKQFRKKQGIKTGIFTTTEIGGNTPAILEAFIDNAYNTWTVKPLAVLLMSDLGSTSKAYGVTSSHFMDHPDALYPDYVSDNIFADLDITDAASEWSNGGAPELVFTRMPAQTAAQCSIMVMKIINYETAPPSAGSFYDLPLSAAGWQDERWFGICSEIVRGFLKNKLGKTTQQQYALVDEYGPAGGDLWSTTDPSALVSAYGPSGENYIEATVPAGMDWSSGTGAGVVSAVNNGTFMIMHRDHGNYAGWGEPAFTIANIPSLANTDQTFVFSMNCQTGAFQHPTIQTFSEMLHRSQYGALGVLCATETSYSFVNDALIMGIMDGLWPSFNSANNWDVPDAGAGQTYQKYTEDLRPAFALASGKWHLMTQSYTDPIMPSYFKGFTCQLFHVFGDPFMTFCSQIPDTFRLSFSSAISAGSQTFSVNVRNQAGANVPGALVGLYMPTNSPEIVTSGLTDAEGNVSFTINPLLDGQLFVTATRSNFVRLETSAEVISGPPSQPAVIKLFSGAKLSDLRPYLSFVSTDPQNNPIDYRVTWDTTAYFLPDSRDSFTTGAYASGVPAAFQFPASLTAGRTYWWKVKGRDPEGTNIFGPSSEPRSLTIGADIPAGTVCWCHTHGSQFASDVYSGSVAAQGDSVILTGLPGGSGVLLSESFEAGAGLPAGWSTRETNNNAFDWTIGTSTGVVNVPPNYGAYYAYVSYPTKGKVTRDADELIAPFVLVPATATDLSLKYGLGYNYAQAGDSLSVWVRFSDSGAWTMLRCFTADVASSTDSINLAAYLPQDSIQFMWRFSSPGGKTGEDGAIDNILVSYRYGSASLSGSLTTGPIYYNDITRAETVSRLSYKWGQVLWRKKTAADSIGVQIEYCQSGSWSLVPDAVLPNNSKVIFNQSSAVDSVSLATLDTLIYDSLRVIARLYRPAGKASADPVLYDIELGRPGYVSPMAVCLSYFAAFVQNNGIIVQWRTESEQECLRWEIERSENADQGFVKVGTIEGGGTTSQPKNYSYTDNTITAKGEYFYRLAEVDNKGSKTYYGPMNIGFGGDIPAAYMLAQSQPNPAKQSTVINYQLSKPGHTSLKIYNIAGQAVKTLVNHPRQAGNYSVDWDGRADQGQKVSTGIYLYRLISGDFQATRKITVLR